MSNSSEQDSQIESESECSPFSSESDGFDLPDLSEEEVRLAYEDPFWRDFIRVRVQGEDEQKVTNEVIEVVQSALSCEEPKISEFACETGTTAVKAAETAKAKTDIQKVEGTKTSKSGPGLRRGFLLTKTTRDPAPDPAPDAAPDAHRIYFDQPMDIVIKNGQIQAAPSSHLK